METLTAHPIALSTPVQRSENSDRDERLLQQAARIARENAERKAPKPLMARRSFEEIRNSLLAKLTPAHDRAVREARAEEAEQHFRDRVAGCRRAAKIPSRYASANFNDLAEVPADVVDQYRAACEKIRPLIDQPAMFALVGPPGGGKTQMAGMLINAFCDLGRRARYTPALTYITRVRGAWKPGSTQRHFDLEQEFVRADLVVIDELTRVVGTPSEDAILLDMIFQRYDESKSTLLIANVDSTQELVQNIDGRLASRIRDDAGGVILCKWRDIRGRQVKPEAKA